MLHAKSSAKRGVSLNFSKLGKTVVKANRRSQVSADII